MSLFGTAGRSSPTTSVSLDPPDLTVIIPAYNEELRIKNTLKKYRGYFDDSVRWKDVTILVVDDGSKDRTYAVVSELAESKNSSTPLECLSMPINAGKGAALAQGISSVFQKRPASLILSADADGSADIADLELLYDTMTKLVGMETESVWNTPAVVTGYRTYESASPARLIFRWGFRTVVKSVIDDLGVQDSQCGFKLMTAAAAKSLYSNLNLVGWSHDVEVLYRAKLLGIKVAEEPIRWNDKDGSKLVSSPGGVLVVSARMLCEVMWLRIAYGTGAWRIPSI